MSDIELACHMAPWASEGLVAALDDIESARFRGIEMVSQVVEQYEDRVVVFNEILSQHRLNLIAITYGGAFWPGTNLDEEVERCLNIARFIKAAEAGLLTLYPPVPNPEKPLEDEMDLMPVAMAYGEIARRTIEIGVQTCLHPEMGTFVDSEEALDRFLQMSDPESMKLCVDVGFLSLAGIPARPFLKKHKERTGLIHLKDLKLKLPKSAKMPAHIPVVQLGRGQIDLEGFVESLFDVEYSGWVTIEFEVTGHKSRLETAAACYKFAENTLDLVL